MSGRSAAPPRKILAALEFFDPPSRGGSFLLRLWTPLGTLSCEHPAGVLGRQGAHLIELLHLVRAKAELCRAQIVVELLHGLGADDDRGHERLCQNPGERDPRDRRVVLARNIAHGVDARPGTILVYRREVECGTTRALRTVAPRTKFSREQPARQGTPDHQSDLLIA